MEPLKRVRSRTIVIPSSNVDTDQIIPARFLTTTTKEGLGKQLFADWRYRADGTPNPDFVLNSVAARGCSVLVAGRNFGCGSSREHAPWALLDYGIRAVISTEIADIFRSNSLKNGLLPITVDEASAAWLIEHPGAEVDIDLETAALDCGDVVAALAAAHVERGASRAIIWEPDTGGLEPSALAQAHEPLLRRLTLLGLDAVAVGAEGLRDCGYAALACATGGRGAALLGADAFGDSASLDAALAGAKASAGADAVLISDGPVPGDCDLTALRRLGERAAQTKTPGGAR